LSKRQTADEQFSATGSLTSLHCPPLGQNSFEESMAMNSHLGPIDVECDALPYPIAKACETLGFRSPLDVRWCRLSQFLSAHPDSFKVLSTQSWTQLFRAQRANDQRCACRNPLPILEQYTFTFQNGTQSEYRIGQCRRCWSIYWAEA
jgi:hypothetical protein